MKGFNCPPLPKTWDDMIVPDIFKTTASNEDFVIMEHTLDQDNKKIIGFLSPSCQNILTSATIWSGDGTFDIVKSTLFTQLFIIKGLTLTGKNVPCGYFLLPSKEYITYKKVFQCLRDREIDPPKIFFCDFEAAISKAVHEVFPEVKIYGCDVHFKRAVRRNLQKHNMMKTYDNDSRLQTYVCYLWGLSLVPVQDVVNVWETFVQDIFPQVDEGNINYFNFLIM